MRTQLLSVTALAAAVSVCSPAVLAQGCLTPPSGLVSWWPGDGSAEDAFDGNGGVPRGVSFAPGVVSEAFRFDGTDGRVFVGDPDNLKLTRSLTIEAWLAVDAFPDPSTSTIGQVVFRGDTRAGLDPYYLSVQSTGALRFHVESGTAVENLEAPITKGKFVHVAATLDDATNLMRIYLDGSVAAETRTAIRPFRNLVASSATGVYIGNLHSPFFEPFDGRIDELGIYDRALSAGEIKDIRDAGGAGKCRAKTYVDLAALPDTNGNGVPEIAVLRRLAGGFTQVVIKDVTGGTVRSISFFGEKWVPRAVTSLDANADGSPDLSVLGVNEDSGEAAVQNRDAVSGVLIGSVGFVK